MLPRCKRRVRPLDTALVLRALLVSSKLGKDWGGAQKNQDQFGKILNDLGLKVGGKIKDAKSGGSRTYESQLSLLGLIFKENTGSIELTKAGEELVGLADPAATLEHQILKLQYPSIYSLSRGVGIDPSIKIRPFNFILRLASDPDLEGLSDRDIIIPIIFGRNDDSFTLCKEKILKLRAFGVKAVIPDDKTIRTARTKKKRFDERIVDINNIANTFKNVLQGIGMIDLRMVGNEVRIFPKVEILPKIATANLKPYIDVLKLPPEQSALQFGLTRGSTKDTRRTFMPSVNPDLFSKNSYILERFMERVYLPVDQSAVDIFVNEITHDLNISREFVLSALDPVLSNPDQYIGANLIELSRGGMKYSTEFEKNVRNIFEFEFGYNEALWTGLRKRDNPDSVGAYMDVFVVELGRNKCGIIDAKSMSRDSYALPHADYAKAVTTYIPSVRELFDKRDLDISFVAYVSHLISKGASTAANKIFDEKKIPVSLISAYGLNNMRSNPIFKMNPAAVTNHLSKEPVNWVL